MFPPPLTDKLTNMLNAKYVRPTTFKASNAEQFRRNAAAFLQSAKDAKQPPIVRYTPAFAQDAQATRSLPAPPPRRERGQHRDTGRLRPQYARTKRERGEPACGGGFLFFG
jgi:hypothetical protein